MHLRRQAQIEVRLGLALAGGARPRRIQLFESRSIQKDKSRESKCSFGFYGPSGETRTRGILVPNGYGRFFASKTAVFLCFTTKTEFLITIIPLIPTIIFLVLVKYVVKNRKGDAKLRHLLPTETLFGVYHRSPKMSSQLQRIPLPSKSICLGYLSKVVQYH